MNQIDAPKAAWAVGMERVPTVKVVTPDLVEIENFRKFRYQRDGGHIAKYETRQVAIGHLQSVDFIVVPFATRLDLAHTMMSFGTQCGQYTVVSVEARRRQHQRYSIIRGTFGAYSLLYSIADEQDAIGLRTEIRGDEVYLYRSNAAAEQVQELFRCILRRVDKLAKSPEKYNSITNNCLTNIRFHVNQIWPGLVPWNWRLLINAHSDFLAYQLGLLKKSETFRSTRQRANITARAKGNWRRDDFSKIIRQHH